MVLSDEERTKKWKAVLKKRNEIIFHNKNALIDVEKLNIVFDDIQIGPFTVQIVNNDRWKWMIKKIKSHLHHYYYCGKGIWQMENRICFTLFLRALLKIIHKYSTANIWTAYEMLNFCFIYDHYLHKTYNIMYLLTLSKEVSNNK